MKKTISINLAGIVFTIDEDAFSALDKYLKIISSYFKEEDGKKEIMSDIESRIAEVFQERMAKMRNVVSLEDVEHVISMMGEPEAFKQEDNSSTTEEHSQSEFAYTSKRLFRDPDNKIVAGVCSGIGHYLGIDPLILRIAFLVALIFFGSGVLLYLILAVAMPKAVSASDKLQMKGQAVTIDNIKRRFEEEISALKKK